MSVDSPDALARLDVTSLVGLTAAEARARVEQIGGVFRALIDAPEIDNIFEPNRVTIMSQDHRVVRTFGFG